MWIGREPKEPALTLQCCSLDAIMQGEEVWPSFYMVFDLVNKRRVHHQWKSEKGSDVGFAGSICTPFQSILAVVTTADDDILHEQWSSQDNVTTIFIFIIYW